MKNKIYMYYLKFIFTDFYGFKCYFGHQQLTDKSLVFVQYDGAPILCDEISFLAAQGDRYQLCFTPVYFHDPYCQIFIEYLSYETGDILQVLGIINAYHYIVPLSYNVYEIDIEFSYIRGYPYS